MGEGAWLVAFLIAQRLIELCFAQLNTRRLRGMGGIEFGAAHYPLIVILHAAWIVGLLILGHGRVIDPFWLSVFIVLQIGRLWVIASLGRRWTTRVIVLPGVATIARGPYRWLRHPNYLIVALEFAVVPLVLDYQSSRTSFQPQTRRCSYIESVSKTRPWPGPRSRRESSRRNSCQYAVKTIAMPRPAGRFSAAESSARSSAG